MIRILVELPHSTYQSSVESVRNDNRAKIQAMFCPILRIEYLY
jgi:hypothetical protein